MTPLSLTPVAETVLTHTFSKAMTRAGEAIGEMSGKRVVVTAPSVRRCSASDVIAMAGGADAIVVAVYVGITGSMTGHALLMLPPDGARRLAGILLDGFFEEPDSDTLRGSLAFDEMQISALQEVGNVTIGAFLNEIGRHLSEPVVPTVPQAVVEMAGAILDGVLMDLIVDSDQILAAETTFQEGDDQIQGTLLVLPKPAPLAVLLDALGALER
jgi:chemotaxis protein CheC